jgi:flagellar biosynthesis protein FlhA
MSQTKAIALPAPAGEFSPADLAVPIAVLCIVVALITPMPGFLLDILIAADLMLSVVIMMVAMYITKPVEFSVFPTSLLLLTLFRLALNVSSSRLILLNGNTGTSAAGHVIEAFGNFVVGGNYIIGAVIFLVLIAIQYVVINHGAVRISEVTARFTLDALPGKQMSIDADLNSGLIDETDARRRRKELASEAEFYGAMDGASRFTQRDAVASILITIINILAGFMIGVLQHGMDLMKALQTYTVLTIGDGLVTVIPALMISISGGLIVTRTSSDTRLGAEFRKQVFGNTQPLFLASGVMVGLSAFPGLPTIPFLAMGAALGAGAWQKRRKSADTAKNLPLPAAMATPKENFEQLLRVEPLAIEVGFGLVQLIRGGENAPLLQRVAIVRRQVATQLGYLLPPVKLVDNVALSPREYVIYLKGAEVARFELMAGCEIAIPANGHNPAFETLPTREPAFGFDAYWISASSAEAARKSGYTVVEPLSVIGTHLAEIVRRYAAELFSRQDAKALVDRVAVEHPKVVEDLVPKLLSLVVVQKVIQNLLRERVSVRDGVTLLEALGEVAGRSKNHVLLTEYVRQVLRRTLVKPYLGEKGTLSAFFLSAALEQIFESAIEHGEQESVCVLAPQPMSEVLKRVVATIGPVQVSTVLITSANTRYFVRQILETSAPNIVVISHPEIPAEVRVNSLGVVQ